MMADDIAAHSVPEHTVDAFHRGAFHACQPTHGGHRSGSDALILAAALPAEANGTLVELGAGAGVASLAALAMNPGLRAVLVEIDAAMATLARQTLALEGNAPLAGRASVLEADATASGTERVAAGLSDRMADHVLLNPPWRDAASRGPAAPMRRRAHVHEARGLEAWLRTAAAVTRPGGTMAIIYPTADLGEVLTAANGRFGGLKVFPLHAAAEKPAGRFVLTGIRGSKAPLQLMPGIVLHGGDGRPTALADALINGKARLSSD